MISLEAYSLIIPLDLPISISFHTFYNQESIFVNLKYKNIIGTGEAAPFMPVTNDSIEDVIRELSLINSLDINPLSSSPKEMHSYLDQLNITSHSLRTALDEAYHDLLGKVNQIPVYKFYRESPKLTDNTITIFISDDHKKTKTTIQKTLQQFPDVKLLKIKLKGEGDLERVKAVKSITPSHIGFTIDANQGFKDPQKAVKDLTAIKNILGKVILVEEPCPKGETDKLKFVKNNLLVMKVFADESAATIEDVKKLIEDNAIDGVNIKLQKAGGIWKGREIAKLCKEKGLPVMVGCRLESAIGIAAGVHFASSIENVLLTDLDADLNDNLCTNTRSGYTNGQRVPLKTPGLGVSLNERKIKELVKSKGVIFKKIV